jgi:hypothetical protein
VVLQALLNHIIGVPVERLIGSIRRECLDPRYRPQRASLAPRTVVLDTHWVRVTVDPSDPQLFTFRAEFVLENIANHLITVRKSEMN